jgi:hypothetical protein
MSENALFQPFFAFIGSKDFIKTCSKIDQKLGDFGVDNYYIYNI